MLEKTIAKLLSYFTGQAFNKGIGPVGAILGGAAIGAVGSY